MATKNKWVNGPGGIQCPCCRAPKASLRDAKKGYNRSNRRKAKQTIQIEESE